MSINNILKKYVFLNDENNEIIKNIDFSKTSVLEVSDMINNPKYIFKNKNDNLHDSIFKFYAYNEILSSLRDKNNGIVSKEDLSIFKDYSDFVNDFSKKIFSFILYACFAESRHGYLLQISALASWNKPYMKEFLTHYSNKSIKNFKKDVKDEIMQEFLLQTKNDKSNEDFNSILENQEKLKELFNTYLKNLNYGDFPIKVREKFEKFFKSDVKNDVHRYYFEEDVLTDLKAKFIDQNNIYDAEKFERFNNFCKFVCDLPKLENGENGTFHRNILKSKLIKKSSVSNLSIEELLEFVSIFFIQGFKDRRNYGGKPWSNIAKHALSFARGEINTEIFIDQALSMEHNNGNMFNKNFIFNDIKQSEICALAYNTKELDFLNVYTSVNNIVLGLQSSSSVLSLYQIDNCNIQSLDSNFLKTNFKTFEKIKSMMQSLPEMIDICKKIDYSIPKFDFVKLMQVITNKRGSENFKQTLAQNIKENDLFSKAISNSNTSLNNIQKIQPFFQLHNLNSNNSKNLSKELIGGKAYGLITLINKGFNVPKALVFDTKTCLSYLDNKDYFKKEYNVINQQISDYLISENKQPLLVSVRSGAAVSMPGMMDSILNVGIDDKTYPKLCKIYGKQMIDECAISFMTQFCSSKLNIDIDFSNNIYLALTKFCTVLKDKNILYRSDNFFPLSKEEQIKLSVEAVFDSWNSPRAIAWRNEKNIDHNMGTAATVQQMVFGNKNDKSFTCVIFSRDCITGKSDIMGEFLPQAQGEDLVSGKRTPLSISLLKLSNPKIYQEIEFIAKTLEEEQKAIQDIEITVEDGKVYVLQMRNAVISPEAQLALAKDMNLNLLDVIQPKSLIGEAKVDTLLKSDYNGLAGSPGLISGIIVRNQEDIDKYKNEGKDLIFFSNQALPEHAPIMITTQGFITEFGGATSHAAILARSMGKPCVVGIGKQEYDSLESGSYITIDANEGKIWKGELPIVINQDKAINLANQILKENKIYIPKKFLNNDFEFKSWTTSLSNYKLLDNSNNKKHKMFLNIAQQTALILQREHKNYLRVSI